MIGNDIIADIARDLVAMWENQRIEGLPRAERNAAIEDIRRDLISAVNDSKLKSAGGSGSAGICDPKRKVESVVAGKEKIVSLGQG